MLQMKKAVLLISLLVVGCTEFREPHEVVREFPIDCHLSGKPLTAFNERIGLIDIDAVGKEYILCRELRTEFNYSLYDGNLNLVTQFARRGRGSGEFLAPDYTGLYKSYDDSVTLDILDRATGIYSRLRISEEGVDARRLFNFSVEARTPVRAVFYHKGHGYFGISDDYDCRFFKTDEKFGNFQSFGNIFEFPDELPVHEIAQNDCCVHPNLTRIAIGWFNFPQLDIRSSDGKIIKTVFINKIVKPKKVSLDDIQDYFFKLVADSSHIYALYNDPEQTEESSILVFDWEGSPIARLRIDRASSFTVDSGNKRIIAINDGFNNELGCQEYSYQNLN